VPRGRDGSLLLDGGKFTITRDGARCEGQARRAEVFAACGSAIVAFSGAGLSVVGRDHGKVIAAIPFEEARHVVGRKPGSVTVEMKAGGVTLRIDGALYLR
jgi:hypothetical protein